MDFRNAYAHGFARVAACTLPVALADPATNAERILEQVRACHDDGVAVAVFPELSLSGYAIDDLFLQDVLLDAVDAAVVRIAEASADLLPVIVVGAPVRRRNRLYNCAVVIHRGDVLGVVPKTFLPDLPRVLREALVRLGRRPACVLRQRPGLAGRRRGGRRAVRPRPHLRRERRPGAGDPRRGVRGPVGPDPAVPQGRAGRRDASCSTSRRRPSPSPGPTTDT